MSQDSFHSKISGSINVLIRYVIAAILVRTSTGASAVAVILLARNYGADGALTGALAACLTAPHVLGPWYGRWLEKANNPFMVIVGACVLFTVFFQFAMHGLESQQLWLVAIALLLAGACSSFLMGGLSTQVNQLVANDIGVRRKAQSWDALTYGLGLTLGPMLVALLSAKVSTHFAVNCLMSLPLVAGVILLSLPKSRVKGAHCDISVPDITEVIKMLWHNSALRTTLFMTSGASFSIACLPVLAVYLSESFQQGQENGAYLVTLYGVGCLCGAISLLVKPLVKEALILLRNLGALLILCLLVVALSSSFNTSLFAYWVCGVVNSIFFTATIAARSEYSPEHGAAQIYMWVAAMKITAASLGALVAGALVDISLTLPLISSIFVLSTTLLLCFGKSSTLRTNRT